MAFTAVQIDPDGPVEVIELPEDPQLRERAIQARLGSRPDRGVYHREAIMLMHGNGAQQLPPNVVATALASAWRGLDVGASYFLHGRVLLVGDADGRVVDLREDLAGNAFEIEDILAGRAAAWRRDAPPASNKAAWAEIVQEAFARIRPTGVATS